MTLKELEAIKGITVKEVDPSKRHVLVIDKHALPQAVTSMIGRVWHQAFGSYPIVLVKSGAGDFRVLEIDQ